MKSCPTCKRTYPDDNLAFCLMDGAVLSAPYDSANAERDEAARGSNARRTEVMNPPPKRVEPGPPLQSPIRARAQQATSPYSDGRHVTQQAATGLIRGAFALRGVVGIFIGMLTLVLQTAGFRIVFLGFAAYLFASGVCALVAGLRAWITGKTGWLLLLDGILGAIGGVLALLLTFVSLPPFFMLAGAWAIGTGTLLAGAAFQLRRLLTSYWLLALAGAISVLYGLALLLIFAILYRPYLLFESYLMSVRLIGGYEVISGVLLVVFAVTARDRRPASDIRPK